MKTKHQTKECSVTLAFAELGRLERDRIEAAAAKQALRERLSRQGHALAHLRARFEAERPKAIARVRAERAERERERVQLRARLEAEAHAAHEQRLALIAAELETKRLRLAAIETSGSVPRPGRRLLEWSVPVATAALVGFLGFTLFDDEAVAQTRIAQVDPVTVAAEPAAEPDPEPEANEPEAAPEPAPEPEPKVEEPASETEPKATKPKATKPKATKPKATKPKATKPKTESKPAIKKNSNPLKLGDFDGNPLG